MKKNVAMMMIVGILACLGKAGFAQENDQTTEKKDTTVTVQVESLEDLRKVFQELLGGIVDLKVVDSTQSTAKLPRQSWWAKSIINQKAPELHVDRWIGEKPDSEGKFTFMYFWSPTCCDTCISTIPTLNKWNNMFKDDMVMIGIAPDDSEEIMRGKPKIEFYRAVDLKDQTGQAFGRQVNTYVLIVDPKGIVRLEDVVFNITPDIIRRVINKYKNN